MMRENHNTQASEYIIIYQDELYIASIAPEDILHPLQDKYKMTIYLQDKYPHDPGGTNICQSRNILKSYMKMLICFSMTNFQQIYVLHLKLSSY